MKSRKTIRILSAILFILIIGYSISKYLYFSFQEDIYYSSNMSDYESTVDYIKARPKHRNIKNTYKGKSIELSLANIGFKLPFDKPKDSIDLKLENNSLIAGISDDNATNSKGFFLIINTDNVQENIKNQIIEIDNQVDTSDVFGIYDYIYSYIPDMNILGDSYSKIKYDLRLSHLKSILLANGGDKNIYKYIEDDYKAFQFCTPKLCRANYVYLFPKGMNDVSITFKNFNQEEIDFVLASIKIR